MKHINAFISILIVVALIISIPDVQVFAHKNNVINQMALNKPQYYNKFNQIFIYDDCPTLKIEAYFDNLPELSEVLRRGYEDYMFSMPENVRMMLKNMNVVVIFVKDITIYPGCSYGMLAGLYNPRYNIAYINIGYDEDYDSYDYALYKATCSLFHELGHAIDYNLGNVSCKNEFKEIFIDENETNYRGLADSSVEMFADIFDYYMWDYKDGANGYSKYINTKAFPRCARYIMDLLGLSDIYSPKYFLQKASGVVESVHNNIEILQLKTYAITKSVKLLKNNLRR